MDDEYKKILNENLSLNKENNLMLHKLIKFQKWNQIYKITYWTIIILSTFGVYYLIKPYISSLFSVYTGGANVSDIGNFKDNISNSNSIQELLKSLNQ